MIEIVEDYAASPQLFLELHSVSSTSYPYRLRSTLSFPPLRLCWTSFCIHPLMAGNPLEAMAKACETISRSVQVHLSRLFPSADSSSHRVSPSGEGDFSTPPPLFGLSSNTSSANSDRGTLPYKGKSATPLTKEELGRSTWTLLHAIAAHFPDQPTRQQKRDAKELMAILSRLYPCKQCADHFKEILQATPVQAGSQEEFSMWLCHMHNVVNRSIGKVAFPCNRVTARWGKVDCLDRACDVEGNASNYSKKWH